MVSKKSVYLWNNIYFEKPNNNYLIVDILPIYFLHLKTLDLIDVFMESPGG